MSGFFSFQERPARTIISEALFSEALKLLELVRLLEELLSLKQSSPGCESEAFDALLDLKAKLAEVITTVLMTQTR